MGISSFRSLLLAAIVLCHCITWTTCKHHYTHNVNGHRSRHRRQGAGLYLSASYILPGGEGSGAWGHWGEVSPCSRTCGGGVASQKRICLEFGSDGSPRCTGGDTKYFSCQTQDCPEGSGDFRAEQCAEYNNKTFRDQKYEWVPYTKGPNQCELNCMPRGERFYYRQKLKVIDGTRCNDESFDICVDGDCQPVGCDMMLGSDAREDKCRRCRGNGTNCYTTSDLLDSQDYIKGYNDILLIPQGATNILIEEVTESNNYLALRAKLDNKYYLNGDYHIDFPRRIVIAGAPWYYERSQQGLAAPDKLRCLGPTTEPLYLSLLLQDVNVGIRYEYSVPSNIAPLLNQEYNWVYKNFSECSAPCGGGYQFREVTCRSREELQVVEERLCDIGLKPATNQTCNTDSCPPQWVEEPWSSCSKPCGDSGTRTRQVYCQKIISNGEPSIVADKECFNLHGDKPVLYEECNRNATCPTWFVAPWKPCDKLCGEGIQTRLVVCHKRINGRVEVFYDEFCTEEKPIDKQNCILHPCEGVDWVLSDWTGCDTCLSTVRKREAQCVTTDHRVVAPEMCAYHPAPILEEPCKPAELPGCQVLWYATQWGKCSADCGEGTQTRRVFCGLFNGESVIKVDDSRCDPNEKYNATKKCFVPKDKCPKNWFAGPWTKCSKDCGGGEQTRLVMCLSGDTEKLECNPLTILDSSQSCNTQPCNKDETIPVNAKTPELTDDYDYEDCEDEDKYPDEAAEFEEITKTPEWLPAETPDDLEGSGSGFGGITIDETESTTAYTTTEGSTTESTTLTETESTIIYTTTEGNTPESTTFTDETETTVTDTTPEDKTSTTDDEGSTVLTTTAGSTLPESDTTNTPESSVTETPDLITTETSPTKIDTTASTETDITTAAVTDAVTGDTKTTDIVTIKTDTTDLGITGSTTSETDISETIATDITTTDATTKESYTTETVTTETSVTETTNTENIISSTESKSTVTETTETESTKIDTTEAGTTETSITETVITDTTVTGTIETSTTEISSTEDDTTKTDTTEESVSATEASTRETEYTKEGATETDRTVASTTEEDTSVASTTEADTTIASTTEESTSDASTTEADTTDASTTEADATDTSTTEEDTSVASTTETGSTGESTTETSTTETGPTETITSEGSTTEDDATISTTDSSKVTTEKSTALTGVELTSELSTTEIASGTTPWGWTSIVTTRKPRCKVLKRKCTRSKFGCCPDGRTAASGPFDEGCPNPKTCVDTSYGCCPDGVSAATGLDNKGCPITPCNETLYGCCKSDNITAAEGNDQDGCPPMPPACKATRYGCCDDEITAAKGPEKEGCPEPVTETERPTTPEAQGCETSEFGCCYDNETDASGPNGEGCPCSISQFGCCPDGDSTALGPNLEGCVMTCKTSAYGCCLDGETPAHGPEQEGCCLQTRFGCCPDNFKAAEGPDLEGCDCVSARFGCCPDNVTIARGPNNEGCGCQNTPYGCCEDRHTAADGPEYTGCSCHTYQFGCCPDGVTVAQGPNLQGCLCERSVYGCCGDGTTPASGPNMQGCDCSNSKYGCCPDGITEARGKHFLNCTDLPNNNQAACALPVDRGSGNSYTVNWFYDMEYGGCTRFWYSGSDGNGNRFSSEAECGDVCVHPSPKDSCKLPMVKGACTGYVIRWYYDSEREQCSQFAYGGCLGNSNNFESQKLCQNQCEPERTEDQCNLEIDAGSCAGNYVRWAYSSEDRRCEQFTWGGCEGNSNRFGSEAACQLRCNPPGQPIQACSLPQEAGNCTEKRAVWSFNTTENRCVPFYYTGCGGNDNRFDTERACNEGCPAAYEREICTLPALTGDCSNYTAKWFYDTSIRRCRQFYYGGCGGNRNNFLSEEECENACIEYDEPIQPPTIPRTQPPIETRIQVTTEQPTQPPSSQTRPDYCYFAIDSGPCLNLETAWAFNSSVNACVRFNYGGCGGNGNLFPSEEHCVYYCKPEIPSKEDVCQQPFVSGSCDQSLMVWFYDASQGVCSQFTYSGCGGNDNRFESRDECESRCITSATSSTTTTSTTTTTTTTTTTIPPEPVVYSSECQVPDSLEECIEPGQVWYRDTDKNECVSYNNPTDGVACRYTGVFTSEEACERTCGAFSGLDVCRSGVDAGPCFGAVPKVYYNAATGRCENFIYGGCLGGPNRFSSIEECEQVCRPANIDPCSQAAEQGNCSNYSYQWYYEASSDDCQQFIYSGCNGNNNRFESREECESYCKKIPTTTISYRTPSSPSTTITTVAPLTTTHEPIRPASACETPASLVPCEENITVYYYDSSRHACVVGDFGGCGYENSYRTEEECERQCGAFRGLDVCVYPLEAGSCDLEISKYYWDQTSGRCLPFTFSGCEGGPNRFSNAEECEEVCGRSGPAQPRPNVVDTKPEVHVAEGGTATLRCLFYGNPPPKITWRRGSLLIEGDLGRYRLLSDGTLEIASVYRNDSGVYICIADNEYGSATQEIHLEVGEAENNEVDCNSYDEECASLICKYGVQRTHTRGCERCTCVPEDVNCALLRSECDNLICTFGKRRETGSDGCERCTCNGAPCADTRCGQNERCVASPYRDPLSLEVRYTTQCRIVNKTGWCPENRVAASERQCKHECNDDADCLGVGKCCEQGCSNLCIEPILVLPTQAPTSPPEEVNAPSPNVEETQPMVRASEGGKATLKCVFHGNPPPKITWKWGAITIEGDLGRYRLLSDGSLEIVSLYRNDSGVYICVADNEYGHATQEIHLEVADPVNEAAGIAGEPNSMIRGEYGQPIFARCLSYGYPEPAIYWYHGRNGPMVPYTSVNYEARDNILKIHQLTPETVGEYVCMAYNGIGKPAEWSVIVEAYTSEVTSSDDFPVFNPRIQDVTEEARTEAAPPTTPPAPLIEVPVYTVPVRTRIMSERTRVMAGSEINLPCDVDGYPLPAVHWTKDGTVLENNDRIAVTEARLTVLRANSNDSGVYGCHAANQYSQHYSTISIRVEGLYIPPNCKDNPYFATCYLIVKSKFCQHEYYSKFCCKSCVEAGQLDPNDLTMQADSWMRRK